MDLILNLKKKYFEDIKNGTKITEYRLWNDYWKKRLLGKDYKNIIIKLGYPRKDELDKILTFPFKGFEVIDIIHEEFGDKEVKVFAIHLADGNDFIQKEIL